MKASLELKIGQRLSMTPQLQQAIRLLQMSSLDLVAEVQEAIEVNPMLEEFDPRAESNEYEATGVDRDDSTDLAASVPENQEFEANVAQTDDQINGDQLASDNGLDYEAQYDPPVAPVVRNSDEMPDIESRRGAPSSLYEHLCEQIAALHLTEIDRYIAEVLVASIDDGGYLVCPVDEVCEIVNTDLQLPRDDDPDACAISVDDVNVVLKHVQNLDPVGVGARNLTECLLLQLRVVKDDPSATIAARIVTDHLEALASRDFESVRKALKCDTDQLKAGIALIQQLNARPGGDIAPNLADYVIPDILVRRVRDQWVAMLNTQNLPNVRVNEMYAGLIKRADVKEDKAFMKEHLNDARWFIKSLQNRHDTLLRVATEIVKRQHAFFDEGDEAMKPMVLSDIARQLDLHESTISRATTQKYMLTPKGVFELKYFFSSGISNAAGDAHSATAIRSMIRKLIDVESPAKPVSDSKIASSLAQQGVKVARRTVAKYREAMNIPASNLRKEMR